MADEGFQLRTLEEGDKSEWLRLWQGYLVTQKAEGLAHEITERTWERLISTETKDMGCVVAVIAGENAPIAFATYVVSCNTWSLNPGMYLEDLYVGERARRRGVATALIRRLEEMCKEKKYSRLFWYTEGDNETAQRVYNRITKSTGQLIYKISFT